MSRSRGFTLLEVLLVLVLMAVSAVAVIATLPPSRDEAAKDDAQSLFQRVQLLNEEAMLSGKDFGLRIDEKRSRYQLMSLNDEGWQALKMDGIKADTQLPEGVALQMTLGADSWRDDDRLFKPGSLFDEDMFADVEEKDKPRPPQIFILSSGELTPVRVTFYPGDRDAASDGWSVDIQENGEIRLLAPGEQDEK
ncbi:MULTISPECIES: type II secretion system minor pseudopilin GspH [Vibrio]|uniref:Type II secretion system protein H n=1 Tax=Vibrio proteolyticus NBRC 13287 TaxID=1219065 RepID=U2ZZ19_VIBPR|nr:MULTISPECIES: type II secretion system minor pseudopilin GspH [Vibrio]NAW58351.1 type II secretion system minor pseudopilin GspH [Vibrio sp. V36_P2S2PM302]NAX22431.1 type II secretion system minor pseudopilin GspH [Vibrio sp. V39_P1S14PM300]NAX25892.1 type II secretion system minor pseudopilin GspH [Vibrio sp. V38_P2S17PM301]NAX29837.1 type II secretion system minor pseudopilin GspH [Vibrio sp. V37_P2S8PM304]GAD66685.1 type II secretion system protein H [Vibrio proteolyticus NBRC 13287]